MSMIVVQELCKGCGVCVDACPRNAISTQNGKAFIDQSRCASCQICIKACPMGALQFEDENAKASEVPQIIENHPERIKPKFLTMDDQDYQNKTAPVSSGYFILSNLLNFAGKFLGNRLVQSSHRRKPMAFGATNNHSHGQRKRRQGRF